MSLLPNQLSPSSAGDFQQCPKLFHFKKILGRPSYSNQASAAGRLTHLVLDEIFEFSPSERTSMVAKELVVPAWRAITNPLADDDYLMTPLEREIRTRNGLWRHVVESGSKEEAKLTFDLEDYSRLAPPGSGGEAQILKDSMRFATSYFKHEDPREIDPIGRELHLNAEIEGVSIHGIIDRLDRESTGNANGPLVISDYKTGKTPKAEHLSSRFFGLRMYALMVAQNYADAPSRIRLLYVRAQQGNGVKEEKVTRDSLAATARQVIEIRRSIEKAADLDHWPAEPGPLCPYCDFRAECPEGSRFVPLNPYSARSSGVHYSSRPAKGKSSSNGTSPKSKKPTGVVRPTKKSSGSQTSAARRRTPTTKKMSSKTSKKKMRFVLSWSLALGVIFGLATHSFLVVLALLPIGGLIGGATFSMSENKRKRYWANRNRR